MPGKMVEIIKDDADGEKEVLSVPFNKLFEITRIQIHNRVNMDVRVRGWDTFTPDTDGNTHSSSENPIPVFDYPVASQDAIVVDCAEESKRVMGTLVVQAHSGTGSGIGLFDSEERYVEVYVGGRFPF